MPINSDQQGAQKSELPLRKCIATHVKETYSNPIELLHDPHLLVKNSPISQKTPQMAPKCTPDDPWMTPRCIPGDPQTDSQMDPQMTPQMAPKWTPRWPPDDPR